MSKLIRLYIERFNVRSYFPCHFELTIHNHQTGKEIVVTPSTRVGYESIFTMNIDGLVHSTVV
jgi:hypothetical protein